MGCLKRTDATSIFKKIVKKMFKSRRKKISYAKDFWIDCTRKNTLYRRFGGVFLEFLKFLSI